MKKLLNLPLKAENKNQARSSKRSGFNLLFGHALRAYARFSKLPNNEGGPHCANHIPDDVGIAQRRHNNPRAESITTRIRTNHNGRHKPENK